MTTLATSTPPARTGRRGSLSEYAVVGLLAVIGIVVLLQARTISNPLVAGHTLSPRVVPYFVGGLLLVVSALLALDIARGGRGEMEGGEDVDLSHGTDWKVLAALVVLVAGVGQLIPLVGFPIAGALLMFAASRILGSERTVTDLVVAVVLACTGYFVFSQLLGVYLGPWIGGS